MFTFKNFRNVYWHGKTHSALFDNFIANVLKKPFVWVPCVAFGRDIQQTKLELFYKDLHFSNKDDCPYSNQKASGNACGHFWHFFQKQIVCLGFTLVLSLESLGALSTAVQHCHLGLFLHLSCLHNTVHFCFCTNPVYLSCSHKKSHHDNVRSKFLHLGIIYFLQATYLHIKPCPMRIVVK